MLVTVRRSKTNQGETRDVSPLHVVAYIRTHPGSAPTVKQHLAAIERIVI